MLENKKKKKSPTGSKPQFNQFTEPVNQVSRFWVLIPFLTKMNQDSFGSGGGRLTPRLAEKAHNDPGAPDYARKYRDDKKRHKD